MILPILYRLQNNSCLVKKRIAFQHFSLFENAEPGQSVFICVYLCCNVAVLINAFACLFVQTPLSPDWPVCLAICHCV